MICRAVAIALCAGACGNVASEPADAAADGVTAEMPTTYSGSTPETVPKDFGGMLGMDNFCNYTITLRMLDVELGIVPSSKQVVSGHVQDLNHEEIAPGTTCDFSPQADAIANYTFTASTPAASGMTLTFKGAAANAPSATLLIDLVPAGTMYTAPLRFHRNDQAPPLDWAVTVTLPLSAT